MEAPKQGILGAWQLALFELPATTVLSSGGGVSVARALQLKRKRKELGDVKGAAIATKEDPVMTRRSREHNRAQCDGQGQDRMTTSADLLGEPTHHIIVSMRTSASKRLQQRKRGASRQGAIIVLWVGSCSTGNADLSDTRVGVCAIRGNNLNSEVGALWEHNEGHRARTVVLRRARWEMLVFFTP
eukprot:1159903-Pelagomonas_calceolata.AAC.3